MSESVKVVCEECDEGRVRTPMGGWRECRMCGGKQVTCATLVKGESDRLVAEALAKLVEEFAAGYKGPVSGDAAFQWHEDLRWWQHKLSALQEKRTA